MQTISAPNAFAAIAQTKPIGPEPHINTLLPKATWALLHAWTPTDRGSINAPSSFVTWSGSLKNQKEFLNSTNKKK